jgi:branched-chain amino acid transport system permease protein
MDEVFSTIVAGVAQGFPLFLAASGLSLIFGVMGTLNFAHGAFFMIGSYMLVTLLGGDPTSVATFLLAALAAGAVVAAIGAGSEVTVFRRMYGKDHVITLLASYALLLMLEGATREVWGTRPRTQEGPGWLAGSVEVLGARVAKYDLGLIVVGALVAIGLAYLLQRTRLGREMRAVAQDRTMALALGIRARRVAVAVFALGGALAGIAGALTAPLVTIDSNLAVAFVLQSFAVVIIGGLGSVRGALLAALLVGLVNSALVSWASSIAGFSLYIAVAAVLLIRPQGLFSTTRGAQVA